MEGAIYMDGNRMDTIHQRVTIDDRKPENDFEYWATVWVKIKTDMLGYFWKEPNEKTIEVVLINNIINQLIIARIYVSYQQIVSVDDNVHLLCKRCKYEIFMYICKRL